MPPSPPRGVLPRFSMLEMFGFSLEPTPCSFFRADTPGCCITATFGVLSRGPLLIPSPSPPALPVLRALFSGIGAFRFSSSEVEGRGSLGASTEALLASGVGGDISRLACTAGLEARLSSTSSLGGGEIDVRSGSSAVGLRTPTVCKAVMTTDFSLLSPPSGVSTPWL